MKAKTLEENNREWAIFGAIEERKRILSEIDRLLEIIALDKKNIQPEKRFAWLLKKHINPIDNW